MIVRSCLHRRTAPPPCPPLHRRPHTAATTRPFHSTSVAGSAEGGTSNLYETLEVSEHATPSEIKKSFYRLSKANHPDLHPNDKAKSQKFVQVSEAYATLGSAEKKQRYDRDFFRARQSSSSYGGGPSPSGSHSSAQAHSGPGGRPASGLSRRRTQFRGPPPSFYRSGGWGEQEDKRKEHAERAAQAAHEASAGMGPGGFAQGDWDDVRHFNRREHTVRQENVAAATRTRRRESGRRKQGASLVDSGLHGSSMLFNFFVVGGTLLGVAGLTGIVFGGGGRKAHAAAGGNGSGKDG